MMSGRSSHSFSQAIGKGDGLSGVGMVLSYLCRLAKALIFR